MPFYAINFCIYDITFAIMFITVYGTTCAMICYYLRHYYNIKYLHFMTSHMPLINAIISAFIYAINTIW